MTTNITVQSCDWPVKIITTDNAGTDAEHVFEETMLTHQSRTVYLTQTRTVQFVELPKE